MTRDLLKRAKELVSVALRDAKFKHGPRYYSDHEAYGVLAEELMEAKKEFVDVQVRANLALDGIHDHDAKELYAQLCAIEHYATNAVCEMAQVAAVARKWHEGMEVRRR